MIYLTQLIFIKEGKEDAFHEFEDHAIPLMKKHGGKILYRIRPSDESYISCDGEQPYEVHFITFESEGNLSNFMHDPDRTKMLNLKDESVRSIILTKGERVI